MWSSRLTYPSSSLKTISRSPSLPSRDSRRSSDIEPRANEQLKLHFSPRASSPNVSTDLNDSTASLNSSRYGQGSSLRKEILATPNAKDPLAVLNGILGGLLNRTVTERHHRTKKKISLLTEEIDFQGLSLDEFILDTNSHESEIYKSNGVDTSAEEYERNKIGLEDLHQSVSDCDCVLHSVEVSLIEFQTELGAVSAEIETLQHRSTALSTKLENRKIVEKLFGPALEELTIPPAVVRRLVQDPIDPHWVAALEILEQRSSAIGQRLKEYNQISAASDLKPIIEDLTSRALERIRDFFVSQIKALRSPNINAQNIQQRAFLAYKDLFVFMSKHHHKLAEEIIQAYSNTMRWYYLNKFTRYMQILGRFSSYTVEKTDALGNEYLNQKGPTASSHNPRRSPNPLLLGRRLEILTHASHMRSILQGALETKSPAHMEDLFGVLTTAVTDNATAEYCFLASFISDTPSFTSLSRVFAGIFMPTFDLAHSFTKQLIDNNYDCLGLLLCVRIIQRHAFSLQRRKCPVVESWINGTNMLLWPKFQLVMDVHVDSVKKATNAIALGSKAKLSITLKKAEGSKEGTTPHPLTQRFAHLLQGILALCSKESAAHRSSASSTVKVVSKSSDIEPVSRSLERLRNEYENFLMKTAKGVSPGRRERYLGNNYSLILTVTGDTTGQLAEEQRALFEERKNGVGEA